MSVGDIISEFEKENRNCVISYGGDGTLLDVARKNNFKKAIFPIRNYGLCEEHKNILEELSGEAIGRNSFKQTIHPLLRFNTEKLSDVAIAEIVIKNKDMTSCMRFDLYVDDKKYMESVISDGVIFATSLGSHGYFKSVTRTIFAGDNIGVGFMFPTYGINNLVLSSTSKIQLKFTRETDVFISADKIVYDNVHVSKDQLIEVSREPKTNLSLFGYDIFCCPECRKNRNSTIINDQYLG